MSKPKTKKVANNIDKIAALPISFAKKPDVAALAGIWKDKDISLKDLRKKAWGEDTEDDRMLHLLRDTKNDETISANEFRKEIKKWK